MRSIVIFSLIKSDQGFQTIFLRIVQPVHREIINVFKTYLAICDLVFRVANAF